MYLRVAREGEELYCGPFVEWYRNHIPDLQELALVIKAIRSHDEVYSANLSARFGFYCPECDSGGCDVCPEFGRWRWLRGVPG